MTFPDAEPRAAELRASELRAAEAWFHDQGLPWFVDAVDDRVRALLRRRRLWGLLIAVLVVAGVAGSVTDRVAEDLPTALLVGVVVALVLLLGYAGGPLRVGVMARWAARRVVEELNLLVPLVTRALPLLLLFMTFLFVNTEVWQVASALPRASLYGVVLLFSGVGVAFLLTRLPEEVRDVQLAAAGDGVARACKGTPLEARARELADARAAGNGARAAGDGAAATDGDPLTGTQRANLLLVLLVTQILQVLLLAVAVFGFFIGFGLLAIQGSVIEAWIGRPPTVIHWFSGGLRVRLPVSSELYQVAVFLSAFAGLYFTVYAVSDAGYRKQFLAELSQGLERAIGVREVYRVLLRDPVGGGPGDPVAGGPGDPVAGGPGSPARGQPDGTPGAADSVGDLGH